MCLLYLSLSLPLFFPYLSLSFSVSLSLSLFHFLAHFFQSSLLPLLLCSLGSPSPGLVHPLFHTALHHYCLCLQLDSQTDSAVGWEYALSLLARARRRPGPLLFLIPPRVEITIKQHPNNLFFVHCSHHYYLLMNNHNSCMKPPTPCEYYAV